MTFAPLSGAISFRFCLVDGWRNILISTSLGETAESSSAASPLIVSATTARQDQYQSSIVFSFSLLVLSLERDAFAGQRSLSGFQVR